MAPEELHQDVEKSSDNHLIFPPCFQVLTNAFTLYLEIEVPSLLL